MSVEIVTKEDLEIFRIKLLDDLHKLLSAAPTQPAKPWLKGAEVRKLLNISAGTLQNLRIAGQLTSKKVGGSHYYRYAQIEKMMNDSQ
jgi:hypothetical protein